MACTGRRVRERSRSRRPLSRRGKRGTATEAIITLVYYSHCQHASLTFSLNTSTCCPFQLLIRFRAARGRAVVAWHGRRWWCHAG